MTTRRESMEQESRREDRRYLVTMVVACSLAAGMWAGTAFAQHNMPKSANKMTLPLVRAYPTCDSPDRCRVSNLCAGTGTACTSNADCGAASCVECKLSGSFPCYAACAAAAPTTLLALGPNGKGHITLSVVKPNKKHPTGDIKISISISDVWQCAVPGCTYGETCWSDCHPYGGALHNASSINNTDEFCASDAPTCGTPTGGVCTTANIGLSSSVGDLTCVPPTRGSSGSKCVNKKVFVNQTPPEAPTWPGAVVAGHGQNIEIDHIVIQDDSNNDFLKPGLVLQ